MFLVIVVLCLFLCDTYYTYKTHIGHIDKGEEFEDMWDGGQSSKATQ